MNIITSQRTYATYTNAEKALDKACRAVGLPNGKDDVRWLIAVVEHRDRTSGELSIRFVPTVVIGRNNTEIMLPLVHNGVMVVN